jgi:hypothetical protein
METVSVIGVIKVPFNDTSPIKTARKRHDFKKQGSDINA